MDDVHTKTMALASEVRPSVAVAADLIATVLNDEPLDIVEIKAKSG